MNATIPRIQMRDLVKSFGSVRVLDGVSLQVMPGEIVALLGSNGAGKSTLVKILTANYTKNSGEIRVNDVVTDFNSPRDAARVGITFLPQEISVFPELSIAENICLNAESTGTVNWADMTHRARLVLDDLGFRDLAPDTLVADLPIAERRIIEIARALESQADSLVMDEPTASLSEQESAQIFTILRRLKTRGTSIVYISHYLKEVFDISDRINVLRDGLNAGEFDPGTAQVTQVVNAMLGKVAGSMFDARDPLPQEAPVVFSCSGLSLPGEIEDVSFDLRAGEILGVFRLIGSGVEGLGRLIFDTKGHLPAAKSVDCHAGHNDHRHRRFFDPDRRAGKAAVGGWVQLDRAGPCVWGAGACFADVGRIYWVVADDAKNLFRTARFCGGWEPRREPSDRPARGSHANLTICDVGGVGRDSGHRIGGYVGCGCPECRWTASVDCYRSDYPRRHIPAGARGSVWGTLVAVLILGTLNNGLTLMNVTSFW